LEQTQHCEDGEGAPAEHAKVRNHMPPHLVPDFVPASKRDVLMILFAELRIHLKDVVGEAHHHTGLSHDEGVSILGQAV